jgi:hypothetical protein
MAKATKRRSRKQPASATPQPRKAAAKAQARNPNPRPSNPRVLRARKTRSLREPTPPAPTPSKPPIPPNPLDMLPNELLYSISDHLGDRDLASACVANKQFYALLYPLLYRRLQTAEIYWHRGRHYPYWSHDADSNKITALQWAAGKGLSRLLERLIEDDPDAEKKDLWSPWKFVGGGQHLLAYAADSGDEDTVKLLLRIAEKMGVEDEHIIGSGAMYRCKGFRVFSILSEEGARRMRLAMRRRGKKKA